METQRADEMLDFHSYFDNCDSKFVSSTLHPKKFLGTHFC
jgi:hypothetical protein